MKILHIIPSLRKGGAESLVIDIARELNSKENIAVRLIILRNEIEYDIEDIKSSSIQRISAKSNTTSISLIMIIINIVFIFLFQ